MNMQKTNGESARKSGQIKKRKKNIIEGVLISSHYEIQNFEVSGSSKADANANANARVSSVQISILEKIMVYSVKKLWRKKYFRQKV